MTEGIAELDCIAPTIRAIIIEQPGLAPGGINF